MPVMPVTLKSTQDGSSLGINTFVVTRSNAGGERIQVRGVWVIKDVWKLTFNKLNTAERDTLIAFLIANRCSCVKYTNEHGEIWHGYIISSDVEITQEARRGGGECADNRLWSISFDLEGIKQ